MSTYRIATITLLATLLTTSAACETRPTAKRNAAATAVRREVNLALQRYADAARAMDRAGSAAFFESNGVMFEP